MSLNDRAPQTSHPTPPPTHPSLHQQLRAMADGFPRTIPTCRERVQWMVKIVSIRTGRYLHFGDSPTLLDEHVDACSNMPPQGTIWVHDDQDIQRLGGVGAEVVVTVVPAQDFCSGPSIEFCYHAETQGCGCPENPTIYWPVVLPE